MSKGEGIGADPRNRYVFAESEPNGCDDTLAWIDWDIGCQGQGVVCIGTSVRIAIGGVVVGGEGKGDKR